MLQDAPFPRSLLPALVAAGLAAPALAQTPPNAGTLLQELRPPALTVPRAGPSVLPEPPALRPPMPAGGARLTPQRFRITGSTLFTETRDKPLPVNIVDGGVRLPGR